LDELIQLIYQGPNKFVLLSAVDSVHWTVHLGLTGLEGRWWKGTWSEKDIFKFLGNSSVSNKLVETFADRLADNIVRGELFIGNWSLEEDAEITLTLNPSAKSPVHISLNQLDPVEAAAYACTIFAEIAGQAQKTRRCHLYQSATQTPNSQPQSPSTTHQSAHHPIPSSSKLPPSTSKPKARKHIHEPSAHEREADEKIKELQAELAHAQQEAKRKAADQPENYLASRAKGAAPAMKPAKGASLANPNKKARRYQAMEFED